jgi:hypothetical protein
MIEEQDIWERVLTDSESNIKNVYSATFFAHRNISIVDQQIRSFNLCYGLSKSGRLNKNSHVAIIGCGISGMTCAVALAVLHDCTVYVFERETTLLRKFREAGFRYIHPDLNHRGNRNGDLNYDPHKKTNFAFMNWSGNYAPLMAEELVNKFEHYRRSTNISLHLSKEVIAIRSCGERVEIEIKADGVLTFDLAIIASGFGDEKRDINTNDDSYWYSGNPRNYQPISFRKSEGAKEKILISGNGDSGVIELAHFLIRDFNHQEIFRYLPLNDIAPRLARSYANSINNLRFREIEDGSKNYPNFSGPISWYWQMRDLIEQHPYDHYIDLQTPLGKLEHAIYDYLHSELASYNPRNKIPPLKIEVIEKQVNSILDKLASYEIGQLVNNYKLNKIYSKKIKRNFRDLFQIKVIGRTPLIYSRRQAPLNWFLLKVLEEYGDFEYSQASLIKAVLKEGVISTKLELTDKSNISVSFDRIIVRHGTDFNVLGYKSTAIRPKVRQSDYKSTDNAVIGLMLNARKGKYEDAFIMHFRTTRWLQAVRATAPLDDFYEGENSISEIFDPDKLLLWASLLGQQAEASKLYREAKASKSTIDKLNAVKQMMELCKKSIQLKRSASQ